MGEKKHDLAIWLGLAILLFVVGVFLLLAKYRPGFFPAMAPVF